MNQNSNGTSAHVQNELFMFYLLQRRRALIAELREIERILLNDHRISQPALRPKQE